jgi:hypothetical protein
LCAATAAALIGCQSAPPQATVPLRATPGAAAQEAGDSSYDWRGLLIAPFGTVLKAIPLTLHEVLLFRDEAHATGSEDVAAGVPAPGAAASTASECYAADTPAPLFAGRTPDEYVLCFARDRLARIQVSVRLTTAEAPAVFAAACAAWIKNAASVAPAAASPNADTSSAPGAGVSAPGSPVAQHQTAEASAAACEGRDGAIRFGGRLGEETDRSEMPPTESTMSITLESLSAP